MHGTTQRTRYCSRCLTTFPADASQCPNLGCRTARPATGWGELFEPGQMIDRTYRVHKMLAIGGAGVTYLAGEVGQDGDSEVGPRVAIKLLYHQRDQGSYLQRLQTEAQILQGLNHAQIVECRGFVHRSGHSPYLVTRYEEGGSLLDHIQRCGTLSIPVVAGIGRQICWALEVAHRQGVVHRDLKPENVLLVRACPADQIPEVKVADFGIAKVYGSIGERLTRVGAFVGTPQYAAPEQFEGLAPEPATDVYAMGALLYFCLTARPVANFMAELDPDSQREHLLRHLPPKLGDDVHPAQARRWMEETLASAMAVDPGDRCDTSQLDARLAAIGEARDPGPATTGHGGFSTGHGDRPSRAPAPVGPPPRPAATATISLAKPERRPPTLSMSRSMTDLGDAAGTPARVGCGLGALATVAGGAGVLALVAFLLMPGAPTVLNGTETDPAALRDWQLVAGQLGVRGPAAARECGAPPFLQIEVVVEDDGAVRSAALLNYEWEPFRACIEKDLRKGRFERAGDGPVQVAVSLPE